MAGTRPVKFGLGDGIEALLPLTKPEGGFDGTEGGDVMLPLDRIAANPGQPRKSFDEAALNELADSIRQHGVIQPIIVDREEDGSFKIIAGERRCRAARIAGLSEIPAIIRSFSDEARVAVSLIENIQRADLNPVEEAAAYRQLMDTAGLSQDEAAARVGKNRSTLANALRLLKLPPAMQDALKCGTLSAGHARAILSLDSEAEREALFAAIMKEGFSVREAERRASKGGGLGRTEKQTDGRPVGKPDAELKAINQKFIEALGTKVSIEGTLEKGQIRIDYFSGEGLQRVYDVITASAPTDAPPRK